ncbi:hypothetical protein RFI_36895, partial [Reticulomyxa filosa]
MNEKIKELQNKTLDYFNSFQERYKKSMDAKNAEELHVVLDKLKIVGNEGPFLQKVLMLMKKKVECDIPEDSSTRKLWSYSEIAHDLNVNLEKMTDDIINEGLVNGKTKSNDMERARFFSQLKEKLDFIKRVSQWKSHLTNPQKLSSCEAKLEKEVESLMKRISEITVWSSDDCSQINLYFSCFVSMQNNEILSSVVKLHIDSIDNIVKNRTQKLESDAMANLNVENVIPRLLSMKTMSLYMFSFKEVVNKRIDEFLNTYKRQRKDGTGIAMLALKLEKDPSGIGEMIVAEHNAFKGYNVALFNSKTMSHGIDYVLEEIRTKDDQIDTEDLKEKFKKFNDLYRQLTKENLQECGLNITLLINNAKMSISKIEQKPDNVKWDANTRNKVPELMAYIFAVWTLQNAHFFFDAKGVQGPDLYLLQPHAAQIIAIFYMLGIDENKRILHSLQKKIDENKPQFISNLLGSKPGLVSNLVQIGTGEGKSVTLAVASCVLALLGFD